LTGHPHLNCGTNEVAVRSLFSVNINENIHNNPSLWQWNRS